jgi:hypothetical protein
MFSHDHEAPQPAPAENQAPAETVFLEPGGPAEVPPEPAPAAKPAPPRNPFGA